MPKILWMSPFSLHDTASGAAVNCHIMLRDLKQRGFTIRVCSALIFDAPRGAVSTFGDLATFLQQEQRPQWEFDDQGIHYLYTRCANSDERFMTMGEAQTFYQSFCQQLDDFAPDIVMGYGLSPMPQLCFYEAHQRGISTVYCLTNGDGGRFHYPNIDLIITDSQATEELYAQRDKLNIRGQGVYWQPQNFLASEHHPTYVTLVNPSDAKGVAIFAKLAYIFKSIKPEVKFLAINTRDPFPEAVKKLHVKGDPQQHPYSAADFPNVFTVEPQADMRPVYEHTAVLLAPSLWYESWGRVASEAVYNGIPVLYSSSGGLPEAAAGGGICIDAPEHCRQDYNSLPDDEEIKPWVESLLQLLDSSPEAQEHRLQMLQRALLKVQNIAATEHVIAAITPLVLKTQSLRGQVNTDAEALAAELNALPDAALPEVSF